eukprot:686187-Pyramimonas_sp.AAC.1
MFRDAESVCNADGRGHLASFHSKHEQDTVMSRLQSHYASIWTSDRVIWIGLTDGRTENTFEWTDGSPQQSGFSNWYPNEPDNFNGLEDCAGIFNGMWTDKECSSRLWAVCKRPSGALPHALLWVESEPCSEPVLISKEGGLRVAN